MTYCNSLNSLFIIPEMKGKMFAICALLQTHWWVSLCIYTLLTFCLVAKFNFLGVAFQCGSQKVKWWTMGLGFRFDSGCVYNYLFKKKDQMFIKLGQIFDFVSCFWSKASELCTDLVSFYLQTFFFKSLSVHVLCPVRRISKQQNDCWHKHCGTVNHHWWWW